MANYFPVHVVDFDSSRRASIAHELYSRRLHAEIYEDIDELIARCPTEGAILIADGGTSDFEGSLETVRSCSGYLPVAFFSADPTPQMIVKAMLSGSLDYLQWPFSAGALEAAIVRFQQQDEQPAKDARRKADARQLVETLTRREGDVLEGIVAGQSNKENAQRLGISPRTVEIHRGNMMTRLNAQSVSDVVRIGLYAGMGD